MIANPDPFAFQPTMTDRSTLSPNGWFNDWLSNAQIYPGYNGNPDNALTKTVVSLSKGANTDLNQAFPVGLDPQNSLMMDGYMTYYGNGFSADNRLKLLTKDSLVLNGKSPWSISKDVGQNFRPLLVVYTNDASTSESTFNLLTDIASNGGTANGKAMPVNVLTNMALQIGALLGARIASANPSAGIDPAKADLSPDQISALHQLKNGNFINGDILLTPDGFGSFIKNYDSTRGSVNGGTTFVFNGDTTNPKLSPDGNGGWSVVGNDGSVLRKVPGSVTVNDVVYTVQDTLVAYKGQPPGVTPQLTLILKDPQGNRYGEGSSTLETTIKPLDLKAIDNVNAKQAVRDALIYLKSIQSEYEKYGVVFPDIFYGSDAEFSSFVADLPGFSPAPGVQLPGLNSSTGETVADLLATQTYLAKLFAGRLNVAHVLNPWGIGTVDDSKFANKNVYYLDGKFVQDGSSVLKGLTTAEQVRKELSEVARQVKGKAAALGWFKASPYMDYLSIDKYERDEISGMTNAGQNNAYNRNAWINYAFYGKQLSEQLRTGPGSASNGAAIPGSGNTDLLYFQIPASSLPADLGQGSTAPFINGIASPRSGSDMQPSVDDGFSTSPHHSFAADSFFGNPDLGSLAAFKSKYPELAGLNLKIGTGSVNLADYLFSNAPNALEDLGSHDLTKGLLSVVDGEAKVNRDIMGDVFGILWGGGNTSTPLSYSSAQWLESQPWTPGASLNTAYVPNRELITPLTNTTNRLADWAAANYQGSATSPNSEVAVRSLGLTYAAVKTGASGKLSLALASQASNLNSIYLYKLKANSDVDVITGITSNGSDPSKSSSADFFRDIKANNTLVLDGLSTQTAGLAKGRLVSDLVVAPNSYYGVLLVSQPKDGPAFASTSYAAAGSWNGSSASDRGLAPVAFVDSSQISDQFFGGNVRFADSRVLGFEDNILSGNPDFDFNDVFFAVVSGGSILI